MAERIAVRAVLLTAGDLILLMRIQEPVTGNLFWITPGGAIEEDETAEEGLRRELVEETGLRDFQVGPLLWTREHRFTWDSREYHQKESYYLVRTDHFEPTMDELAAPGEWSAFRGFAWWSLQGIRESDDVFAPRRLAELLGQLIDSGPPEHVLDAGV